jgi:thiosulfate/3-mercaptopyruvate sulfurtransferase
MKPLITISELKEQTHPVLIDARGGADALERFKKGHLPRALFVDLETQLSKKSTNPKDGGRHPLPPIQDFGALLGQLGITPSSHVIVYDNKNGANAAARFWWMLKGVGHQHVQVLDGGLQAALSSGIHLSTEIERTGTHQSYPVTTWLLPVVDLQTVKQATTLNEKLIIDVREGYRFNGESEPIDAIAGHIPNAINVPYIHNLQEDGTFLSAGNLLAKFNQVIGNKNNSDVIVHCGSGVTACHTLLAMHHAGITGANLYVGSWSEWSRNNLPMVTQTAS